MTTDDGLNDTLVIWIIFALAFVIIPCICQHRRKRIICCRRILQRRWNVRTDDIADDTRPYMRSGFTPTYPRGDPRHVATPEESESEKKEYILGQLKEFTKIITETDLKTVEEAEFLTEKGFEAGSTKIQQPRRQSIFGMLRGRSNSTKSVRVPEDEPNSYQTIDNTNLSSSSVNCNDDDDCDCDGSKRAKPEQDEGSLGKVNLNIPGDSDDIEKGNVNEKPVSDSSESETGQTVPSSESMNDSDARNKEDAAVQKVVVLKVPCQKKPLSTDKIETAMLNGANEEGPICKIADGPEDVRYIIPECAICLNECKVGEAICCSPQQNCVHVFHEDCILTWFLTLGRKADARHAHFKMRCPVCRQDFIQEEDDSSSTDV